MGSLPGGSAVTVRVVGTADQVVETIEAAGYPVRTAVPADVEDGDGDPSVVVTVGERALLAVARERPTVPILPVDTDIGPGSADRRAILAALAGDATEHAHPILSVSVAGESTASAFMDVTLVTTEPARISEYAVDHADERVAAFRADGVVVTTPAGSHGYAAAAGGPTLAPTADALCVVPIAPFHTQATRWVLDTSALGLSVLRDEGEVSLLVDDTEYGVVDPDQRVRLAVDGHVRTLRL